MQNPQWILAKYIWYDLKGSYTTMKCNLFQGFKDGSISANQSTWHNTLTNERIKRPFDHLSWCKENFGQNSISIYGFSTKCPLMEYTSI